MSGIRRRVADALYRVGAIDAILTARRRAWSPWLTVVTYHRIEEPSDHRFDRDVIDATPAEFDAQLELFARYFSFVSVDQVRGFVRGAKLPPNPLLVTFDDGYRDNYEVALPILERHGVRAVFFIATTYVTERRVFWWDRMSYILGNSSQDRVDLDYPRPISLSLSPDRAGALRSIQRLVKDTYNLDLDKFLDELGDKAGVAWSDELERRLADELVMTWEQVRALRRAGQDVQSHTRRHRVLQTLPPNELADELAGSMADLEREIGERPFAISYPVGKRIAQYAEVRRAVAGAGYEVGFSNASGANALWRRDLDPLDLRRIAVEQGLAPEYFRSILAIPALV